MVSGPLALLYFLLSFLGGGRAAALIGDKVRTVEWGDFPFICLFPPLGHPAWPGWLGLRPGWMAQRGERMDKWTDGQTDGQTKEQTDGWMDGWMDGWTDGWTNGRKISPFYRTLCPIGAAAQKKRGEGWRERRNEERIGHMKQVLEEKKLGNDSGKSKMVKSA